MTGLETLYDRREKRCLDFLLKCLKHSKNHKLFPLNAEQSVNKVRNREIFIVNFTSTEAYRMSTFLTARENLMNTLTHHNY